MKFLRRRFPLFLFVVMFLTWTVSGLATAQSKASPEALKQLLPEQLDGFERKVGMVGDRKNGPIAQATYFGENEGNQVVFEVEISSVTEEQKEEMLGELEGAPSEIKSKESHEGHDFYVITVDGKAFLVLFADPFHVYMEGNASPADLRTTLKLIDIDTLAQLQL